MATPDKVQIRALIWERGYTIAAFARKIGRPRETLWAITGRKNPRPVGVDLIRQIANGLSRPGRVVKPSDISDWTGDDDLYETEPEPKVPAA
jgi:hypothetical protein